MKPKNTTGRICQVGGPTISHSRDGAVYLVDLEELILIDSGTGIGFPQIVSNIKALGFRPEDISAIILTHCHMDHMGGASLFRAKFGSRLIMHALDAEIVERGDQRMTAAFCYDIEFMPLPIDIKLYGDKEELQFGDFVVNCPHTPGHTPGSISPYIDLGATRILFAQDIRAPLLEEYKCDPVAWRRSIDKLLALEADILCDGHTGAYHPKARVKAYLERSLRANGFG